jgi:biotin carboxylase
MHQTPLTIYCLAGFFKGNDFLRECHDAGHRVVLVTREKASKQEWAIDSIDSMITVPNDTGMEDFIHAVSDSARLRWPDLVIALEESDVITAARIREHLCLDGMWSSEARIFRDKLAMRRHAGESGIRQAAFAQALHYQHVGEFMERVPGPWVLKPRADASAIGIKKYSETEDVWKAIDKLNAETNPRERAGSYLIEEFIAGEVFHVDSLICGGRVVVAGANRYGNEPLKIAVEGGISTSMTVEHDSPIHRQLIEANEAVVTALGLKDGVAHTEFIKADCDGEIYFLEIGARVGGAYTAEAFEAATGLNLWREWAKIVTAASDAPYQPAPERTEYGAILVSLSKQQFPDTSAYNDPEVFYRAKREYHVGLVLASPDLSRLKSLVEEYKSRFERDFMSFAPQQDRP